MYDRMILCLGCMRGISDEATEMANAVDMGAPIYHQTPPETGERCGPVIRIGENTRMSPEQVAALNRGRIRNGSLLDPELTL